MEIRQRFHKNLIFHGIESTAPTSASLGGGWWVVVVGGGCIYPAVATGNVNKCEFKKDERSLGHVEKRNKGGPTSRRSELQQLRRARAHRAAPERKY